MSTIPAELTPPALPRRRQFLFGTVFASIAVAIFELTLIAMYLAERSAKSNTWLSEHTIPLTQPNVLLTVLGFSVVFVQWAVWAIGRDERRQAYVALGLTALMGAAFLNTTTFLWSEVKMPLSALEGPLFYAVTGSHFVIVILALAFLLFVSLRTLAGSYSSKLPDGVSAAALFWNVTVALYAVLWLAVYIMK